MGFEQKDSLSLTRMPSGGLNVGRKGSDHERSQGISNETGFIDEKQLLARLPISRRTLGNWKVRGIIPFIKDRQALSV